PCTSLRSRRRWSHPPFLPVLPLYASVRSTGEVPGGHGLRPQREPGARGGVCAVPGTGGARGAPARGAAPGWLPGGADWTLRAGGGVGARVNGASRALSPGQPARATGGSAARAVRRVRAWETGGSARGRPAGPRVGDRRVRAWEAGGSARGRPESHVTDRDPALRTGIPRVGGRADRAREGGRPAWGVPGRARWGT